MSLEDKDKNKGANHDESGSNQPDAPLEQEVDAGKLATNERDRIFGILKLPEAEGRDALAKQLANMSGMEVDQAKGILSAAALETLNPDAGALDELAGQHGEQLESGAEDNEGDSKHQKAVSLLVKSDQG